MTTIEIVKWKKLSQLQKRFFGWRSSERIAHGDAIITTLTCIVKKRNIFWPIFCPADLDQRPPRFIFFGQILGIFGSTLAAEILKSHLSFLTRKTASFLVRIIAVMTAKNICKIFMTAAGLEDVKWKCWNNCERQTQTLWTQQTVFYNFVSSLFMKPVFLIHRSTEQQQQQQQRRRQQRRRQQWRRQRRRQRRRRRQQPYCFSGYEHNLVTQLTTLRW